MWKFNVMKLTCLVSLVLFFFIMSGCLHQDSISAKEAQLQKDTLSLHHLNLAYQEDRITPLEYVKEHNILMQRIRQERELLGNGHTHQH
jgi:hypothetical protein